MSLAITAKMDRVADRLQFSYADLVANRTGRMSPDQIRRAKTRSIKSFLAGAAWIVFALVILYLALGVEKPSIKTFFVIFMAGLVAIAPLKVAIGAWRASKDGVVEAVTGKATFDYIKNRRIPIDAYPFLVQFLIISDKRFKINLLKEDLFESEAIYKAYFSPRDPQKLLSLEKMYLEQFATQA